MQLNKREHIALEVLKSKNITVDEAYKFADDFISKSVLAYDCSNVEEDWIKQIWKWADELKLTEE